MIELRLHASITEIPESEWDALLGDDGVPYLRWCFLEALEKTGCVGAEAGWAPAYLSFQQGGERVAVAPAYVKDNSEGEFVFDYAWAEFSYQRLGVAYYPKLVVACPFTPATGPRLLVQAGLDPEPLYGALAEGVRQWVERIGLSSAHVLFPRQAEAQALEQHGMALRLGIQYHWYNAGYATFDDFLQRYNSKRRHQIRRERAEIARQGLEIEVLTGSDVQPQIVDHVYDFYCATVNKYFWGRQYLNRAFFEEVCARMPESLLVVLARERASNRVVGGAFNLMGNRRLFGRYWGAREDWRFLHFNVCYYRGIEECIARGLEVFEPGAGGEHKVARGFEPTRTYSTHHLAHPALNRGVRDFLRREASAVNDRIALEKPVLSSRSC